MLRWLARRNWPDRNTSTEFLGRQRTYSSGQTPGPAPSARPGPRRAWARESSRGWAGSRRRAAANRRWSTSPGRSPSRQRRRVWL